MKRLCILLTVISIGLVGCANTFSHSGKETMQEGANTQMQRETQEENISKKDDVAAEKDSDSQRVSLEQVNDFAKRINDEFEEYEYALIYADNSVELKTENPGDSVTIELDERECTRASGFARSINTGKEVLLSIDSNGEYAISLDDNVENVAYELPEEELDRVCLNFFGRRAEVSSLNTRGNFLYDVIKMDLGGERAVRVQTVMEDEGAYEIYDTKVKLENDEYILEKEVYCGYWGYASYNRSNFKIRYGLRADDQSEYGMSIGWIGIKRLVDENKWSEEEIFEEPEEGGFYGIWVLATKDEGQARQLLEKLCDMGFEAELHISSEWRDLNQEKWYVVTTGRYETEEEANYDLPRVKDAGFAGAYIKFTGDYMGRCD